MIPHSGGFVSVFSHFPDALAADIFSAEGNQIPEGTAEHAGRFKLLQNDAVILHVNFQFIPFGNVQCTAQFDWQNDSSQFVHFPDNTS